MFNSHFVEFGKPNLAVCGGPRLPPPRPPACIHMSTHTYIVFQFMFHSILEMKSCWGLRPPDPPLAFTCLRTSILAFQFAFHEIWAKKSIWGAQPPGPSACIHMSPHTFVGILIHSSSTFVNEHLLGACAPPRPPACIHMNLHTFSAVLIHIASDLGNQILLQV